MSLATAPAPSTTSPGLEDVIHLVCECQLGDDGLPLALPVEALCGFRDRSATPMEGNFWSSTDCPMCIEVLMTSVCRRCEGGA